MVEQRTENSCVAGSSPACGTKQTPRSIMDNTPGYELGNGGSIPSAGTNKQLTTTAKGCIIET
jgi:hypothetical protein